MPTPVMTPEQGWPINETAAAKSRSCHASFADVASKSPRTFAGAAMRRRLKSKEHMTDGLGVHRVRCDRQLPCKTCVGKGIALSCTYTPGPQREGTTSVGERIYEQESLVRSLVHQQTPQTPAVPPGGQSVESPTPSSGGIPGESPPSAYRRPRRNYPLEFPPTRI